MARAVAGLHLLTTSSSASAARCASSIVIVFPSSRRSGKEIVEPSGAWSSPSDAYAVLCADGKR